ncbi:unnamed protein product, partial [Trichogramma brassicae]
MLLLMLSLDRRPGAEAFNILGICPSTSYSHQQPFQALMKALAQRGHKVTVISPIPLKSAATASCFKGSIRCFWFVEAKSSVETRRTCVCSSRQHQACGMGSTASNSRKLYGGLSAGLQRQMCFASVRLGLYDSTKIMYADFFQGTFPNVTRNVIINVAEIVCYDIVKDELLKSVVRATQSAAKADWKDVTAKRAYAPELPATALRVQSDPMLHRSSSEIIARRTELGYSLATDTQLLYESKQKCYRRQTGTNKEKCNTTSRSHRLGCLRRYSRLFSHSKTENVRIATIQLGKSSAFKILAISISTFFFAFFTYRSRVSTQVIANVLGAYRFLRRYDVQLSHSSARMELHVHQAQKVGRYRVIPNRASLLSVVTKMKMSFSLSSLQPSSKHLERAEHAKSKMEKPFNSLNKKRKEPVQEECAKYWSGTEDSKDDFWAAIQTNYDYIMDTNLIDTCKAHTEELRRKAYRRRLFNEQAEKLIARAPSLKEEVYWRVDHLNAKWNLVEQIMAPVQRSDELDQQDVTADFEHEVKCLRKWLREMEDRLQPLNFHVNWSRTDVEEKAIEHMLIISFQRFRRISRCTSSRAHHIT